ncbi:hypothetical protein RvY_02162 [Ramazzottius varieornatus]|uniref:Transposase Tc1-like domain-containing protein n=1 Tax=Ramazzottius varieornatus TaxID=947166 RepID=A0A1D1UPQ0_RAMVA|nr:hypothetical protein RvY_02162 [Ramazzottius varieornatus]
MALHTERLSYKQISSRLADLGTPIHYKMIGKLINEEGKKQIGWAKPARRLPPQNLPTVRTKDTIKKVKRAVLKTHPDSHRKLSHKLGCSLGAVSNIIHRDLGLNARKKKKTIT